MIWNKQRYTNRSNVFSSSTIMEQREHFARVTGTLLNSANALAALVLPERASRSRNTMATRAQGTAILKTSPNLDWFSVVGALLCILGAGGTETRQPGRYGATGACPSRLQEQRTGKLEPRAEPYRQTSTPNVALPWVNAPYACVGLQIRPSVGRVIYLSEHSGQIHSGTRLRLARAGTWVLPILAERNLPILQTTLNRVLD